MLEERIKCKRTGILCSVTMVASLWLSQGRKAHDMQSETSARDGASPMARGYGSIDCDTPGAIKGQTYLGTYVYAQTAQMPVVTLGSPRMCSR